MNNNIILEEYLQNLENKSKNSELKDKYLWPRTPDTETHQDKILQRVGATDYDVDNPISRPYKVIKSLKKMIKCGLILQNFSLVDITCGDAIVLSQLKKTFPNMYAYGVDCFKDRFVTHKDCYKQGIKIYNGYIQDMFIENPKTKFDCAIMFNSYRGWESADLRDYEKDLPSLADKYFENNVKFIFLTVVKQQIINLKKKGFLINILGRGEDNSIMIVMTHKKNNLKFSLLDNIKNIFLFKKYMNK